MDPAGTNGKGHLATVFSWQQFLLHLLIAASSGVILVMGAVQHFSRSAGRRSN